MQNLFSMLQVIVVLAYPLMVYQGLTHFSARGVGLLVLILLLPGILKSFQSSRQKLKRTLGLPITVVVMMLLSMIFNDTRFILAYPALVNLALLIQFASSLRPGVVPLVERFARLRVDDLSEEEIKYCRTVTICWSIFFVLNSLACAGFALFGSRKEWAIYTGFVAYLILGLLFAIEFTVRKYRFRRYGPGVLDKIFSWIFPPRAIRQL